MFCSNGLKGLMGGEPEMRLWYWNSRSTYVAKSAKCLIKRTTIMGSGYEHKKQDKESWRASSLLQYRSGKWDKRVIRDRTMESKKKAV